MKTKFTVKPMLVEVVVNQEKQSIQTPEIQIEFEGTVKELAELYALEKQIIKEAPSIFNDLAQQMNDIFEMKETKTAEKEVEKEFERVEDFIRNYKEKIRKNNLFSDCSDDIAF